MKNKIIFFILLVTIVTMYMVYINRKNNNNNNIIPEEISVSTTKNTSKNTIANLSDYPDKILEIKKEVINNENQYVVSGWINTNDIDVMATSIKMDLFPFSYSVNCLAIDMSISKDKVYIIKDNEEKLIATKDTINWQNDQWINYKVYATIKQESMVERVFKGLIGDEVQASCHATETLKNIKKIVFQMPEVKEKQTIEAMEIYKDDEWDSDRYTIVVPKENQNLSLLINNGANTHNRLPEQPFLRSISLNNQKIFVRLINDELIEIKHIASLPFFVFKDYTLEGKTYCSKFNQHCVFSIEKLIVNTTLEKNENNITAPFEYTFKVDDYIYSDNISLSADEGILDYLNLKYKSTTINVKDVLDNNINIEEKNGRKHISGDLYVKGKTICEIDKTKPNLNCIIEPAVIEMK